MYRLYDYLPSSNGYKVRLTLRYLGLPYERVEVDVERRCNRLPEFLAKNPNGRVPLLEVPERGYLAESNAIVWYLAEESRLIPSDRFDRSRMLQWMSFEQYDLEPSIGTVRYWMRILKKTRADLGDKLIELKKKGYAALDTLEDGLRGRTFLAAEHYTLADISTYACTHVASEAEFDLTPYPNIQRWCALIASQHGWAPMTEG
jgi:glutathione S-transferase